MPAVRGAVAALTLLLAACSNGSASRTSDSPDSSSPTTASAAASASASPSPSDTTGATGSKPPPPKLGACYRLTFAEATRPTSNRRPVPCAQPHTTQTIYVGRLDTVVAGHSIAVDSDRAQRQLATTCPAKRDTFLGGTPESRQLSRFQVVWFSPTLRQAEAGATWFRCDLLVVAGTERLLWLPPGEPLGGVLGKTGALSDFGLCGTAQPGAAGFERVACALRHSWVAVSTIPLSGGMRFPGVPAVRAAGDQECADTVRRRAGLPLRFEYGWEWPTRQQWAAGQRFGYCWAPEGS